MLSFMFLIITKSKYCPLEPSVKSLKQNTQLNLTTWHVRKLDEYFCFHDARQTVNIENILRGGPQFRHNSPQFQHLQSAGYCKHCQPIRELHCSSWPIAEQRWPLSMTVSLVASLRLICDKFAVEGANAAIIFNLLIVCFVAGSGYSPDDPLLISEQGEIQDGHYFIKVIIWLSVNCDGKLNPPPTTIILSTTFK